MKRSRADFEEKPDPGRAPIIFRRTKNRYASTIKTMTNAAPRGLGEDVHCLTNPTKKESPAVSSGALLILPSGSD